MQTIQTLKQNEKKKSSMASASSFSLLEKEQRISIRINNRHKLLKEGIKLQAASREHVAK